MSAGATAGVVASIYIAKGAVARAVSQAAEIELERLKASLQTEMELERQAFSRDLERERAAAARDLEVFKADLSLPAEVRRQLAARKVAAVLEIVALGEPLIRTVFNARRSSPEDQSRTISETNLYVNKVRELSFLFDNRVAQELHDVAAEMLAAGARWERNQPDALDAASKAYAKLIRLVRLELGVTSPPSVHGDASTPPPA